MARGPGPWPGPRARAPGPAGSGAQAPGPGPGPEGNCQYFADAVLHFWSQALLQIVHRDTMKGAFKCSYANIDGMD